MNTEPTLKRCPKCGNSYPRTTEYFSRHSQSKDGLRCYCKTCHIRDNHRYRDYYCGYMRHYHARFKANRHVAPLALRDAGHLANLIRRMVYGDAITAGMWQLERQCMQQISDTDNGKVTGSYAEYLLYRAGRLYGAYEVRGDTESYLQGLVQRIASDLLRRGWQLDDTRHWKNGAQTNPETPVSRVKRLLKESRPQYAQIGAD